MGTNTAWDDIRKQLEEERARLLEHVDERTEGTRRSVGVNPDRSDLASDYIVKDRRTALLSIERKMLAQVEDALTRLDEGTYGTCLKCGEEISPERLEAVPFATLCIRCQQESS